MSAPAIYKPNIANFHLSFFNIFFDYYFSQTVHKTFYSYNFERGIDMLPKRSTPVDQNLESKSTHSQLSVAIFIARRIHLGPQKSVIYEKKSKKCRTHNQPILLVIFLRDIWSQKVESSPIFRGFPVLSKINIKWKT